MWVATGFGLEKISYDGIRDQEYEKSLLSVNYIIDLEIINDVMLWVATDQGILKIDTWNDYDAENIIRFSESDTLPPLRQISDNLVHDILPIEDKIWVATGSGVVIIDTTTNSVTDFNSDLIARVISQDSRGNIWLGTEMDGLFKIPNELLEDIEKGKDFELEGHIFDKSYTSGISSSQITCITEDKNGVIWVGTNGGLNKYVSEKDNFDHYFVQDGLPSNYITGVVVDDSNGLWISSKKGISFYDQNNLHLLITASLMA
jgi:Predicted periplasmic ligand-binding sensor domain